MPGTRCVVRLVVAARPASPSAEEEEEEVGVAAVARHLPADRGPCICIDSRGGRPRVSAVGGGASLGADGGPIRLSLRRPPHWRWQLTASRSCPAVRLTDERGALLAHTGPPPRQRPAPAAPPPPPSPPPSALLAPPPAAPVRKSGSSLRRRPSIRRGARSLPVSRVGSFRPSDDHAPRQDRQANDHPMTGTTATAASSGTSLAAPAVLVNGCLEAAAAAAAVAGRRRRRRRRRERVAASASSSSSSASASPRAPRRHPQQQQQRARRRKSAPDAGDRLVRVDGRPLRSFPEAARLLRGDGAPGGEVRLRLAPADHADHADPGAADPSDDAHLMGSNVSRHAGKRGQGGGAGAGAGGPGAGLAGRRALSSGSLCNGHNHKGGASARAAVPGGEGGGEHGERAKLCGSLPNHLDGSDDGGGGGLGAGPGPGPGELADRNGGLELRLQPLRPAPVPPGPSPSPSPSPAPAPLYAPAPPLAAMASLAPTPPPSLSPQPPPHAVSVCVTELYPFITPEATFAVALARGPRGLGLSLAGGAEDARDAWPGLVRVKRLFPQQPAWASGRLRQGDILLAANGVPLLGLTSYEALEVLRRAAGDVVLTVCRPPAELCCLAPPCEPPPPPPPPRRLPPANAAAHAAPPPPAPHLLSPPALEGVGEEVVVTLHKVNRSLGFTLRRGAHAGGAGDGSESDSGCADGQPPPSGHFVRALVREPALSDGRVRPGDQILEVNGLDVGGLTHEEAVAFLRRCGDEVTLRLRRPAAAAPPPLAAPPSPWGAPPYDLSATPPAPLSPSDDERPLRPKMLRREAMDMLSELAGRRLSPGDSSGSSTRGRPRRHASPAGPGASPGAGPAHAHAHAPLGLGSPQRRRPHPHAPAPPPPPPPDSPPEPSPTDAPPLAQPPDLLAPTCSLDARAALSSSAAPSPTPSCASGLSSATAPAPAPSPTPRPARPDSLALPAGAGAARPPGDGCDGGAYSSEAAHASLPPLPLSSSGELSSSASASSAATAFSCRQQPVYQSAQPAVRTSVSGAAAGAGAGPERASEHDLPAAAAAAAAASEGPRGLLKWKGVVFTPEAEQPPGANDFAAAAAAAEAKEPLVGQRLTVELSRGWNARLGFSLRAQGLRTVVSAVHADSVAARDGRLRAGDLLVEVNEESVEHMTTADIIDLLRKIRGTIAITVVRPPLPPPLPVPETQPA